MQPLLLLIKNDSFFVHENQRLTRKKQMRMRILSLVSVQL